MSKEKTKTNKVAQHLSIVEGRILTILEALEVVDVLQLENTGPTWGAPLGNSSSDAIKHLIRDAIWRDIDLAN